MVVTKPLNHCDNYSAKNQYIGSGFHKIRWKSWNLYGKMYFSHTCGFTTRPDDLIFSYTIVYCKHRRRVRGYVTWQMCNNIKFIEERIQYSDKDLVYFVDDTSNTMLENISKYFYIIYDCRLKPYDFFMEK